MWGKLVAALCFQSPSHEVKSHSPGVLYLRMCLLPARPQGWFPDFLLLLLFSAQIIKEQNDSNCSFWWGVLRGCPRSAWCGEVAPVCDTVWLTKSRSHRAPGWSKVIKCSSRPRRCIALLIWRHWRGMCAYRERRKDNHGFLLQQLQPVPLMDVQRQTRAAQGMRSFVQMVLQTSW